MWTPGSPRPASYVSSTKCGARQHLQPRPRQQTSRRHEPPTHHARCHGVASQACFVWLLAACCVCVSKSSLAGGCRPLGCKLCAAASRVLMPQPCRHAGLASRRARVACAVHAQRYFVCTLLIKHAPKWGALVPSVAGCTLPCAARMRSKRHERSCLHGPRENQSSAVLCQGAVRQLAGAIPFGTAQLVSPVGILGTSSRAPISFVRVPSHCPF